MVFTAGIFIVLTGCGGPDLGEVAEFHRSWGRAYTASEKNELLTTLVDIEPEWSTPEERSRWSEYVRAHQLGYWADEVDEALSLRAVQLLEKNGIVDGYVGCIYLSYWEAAEVGEPTRLALEELDFTLMTEVCPYYFLIKPQMACYHNLGHLL